MPAVTIQFLGAGDAFGSGGRFQPCISVRSGDSHVLLDCGASSLVALKRLGLDPGSIDAVCLMYTSSKYLKEAMLPHHGS